MWFSVTTKGSIKNIYNVCISLCHVDLAICDKNTYANKTFKWDFRDFFFLKDMTFLCNLCRCTFYMHHNFISNVWEYRYISTIVSNQAICQWNCHMYIIAWIFQRLASKRKCQFSMYLNIHCYMYILTNYILRTTRDSACDKA